jgi:hypothetical protein
MKDLHIDTSAELELWASHDGERWSLHVTTEEGVVPRCSASLTTALNYPLQSFKSFGDSEMELDSVQQRVVDDWHDDYDSILEENGCKD